MNFSSLSIKNPIPAIMLFALLSLAGMLAYKANPVQDFPDIELPIVTVNASLPGAAPAQLETEVARKIEDSVATLQGVKNIYTKVLDGTVTVTVEFILEKQIPEAVNDVRDAVARVKADMPAELRDPTVTKATTAGRVVLTFIARPRDGASNPLDATDLSWFVDNTVSKRLLAVPGVGAVNRVGGVYREIQVELDEARMAALKVSALDVSRQLRLVQREAPGGRGDVSGAEQSVRTIATVQTADELSRIDLPLPDGRHVRLDQVATVRDTIAEPRALAEQNGKTVVAFEVFRTKGASDVTVAKGARAAIAQLQKENQNIVLEQAIDNAVPVEENFDGSMELLYEGALLAVLVVWWFLRDWRATLVAAAALPLSVMPAFLGIYWFGYTLNTVTLLSLALVVGVLVDDAIVEIENISRHLRMGKTPMEAAMEAADEIGMAVIATTFALVAVFLPTAFMGGIPGLFFKQFGWTAVIAVLASLLVARILTPMMAAYLLKAKHVAAQPDGAIMRWYLHAVRWCLMHRKTTMLAATLFFVASVALIPFISSGLMPPADRGYTTVNVELPPGSSLQNTTDIAEAARIALAKVAGIDAVFTTVGVSQVVGGGQLQAGEVRNGALTLSLADRAKRP